MLFKMQHHVNIASKNKQSWVKLDGEYPPTIWQILKHLRFSQVLNLEPGCFRWSTFKNPMGRNRFLDVGTGDNKKQLQPKWLEKGRCRFIFSK